MHYLQYSRQKMMVLLLICFSASLLWGLQNTAGHQTIDDEKAGKTETKPVSIIAAKRGNPYVNFDDGRDLELGSNAAAAQPVALVSADFDSDGISDVVTADTGGSLQLLKGVDSSVFALDPARKEQVKPEPFTAAATGASLDISPDYLFAGDFNADGKQDILGTAKGANGVVIVAGDGTGHFSPPADIVIDGGIGAIESGEIGKPDGQADLAIAYSNKNGSFLAVYEHPESAFKHPPEIIKLPSGATSLAIGNTDEDFYADIVVACGIDLVIVHERGQVYPWDVVKDSGIVRPPAAVDIRRMPFPVVSMAVGRFGENRGTSLALLGGDGNIYHLKPTRKTGTSNNKFATDAIANVKVLPFTPTDADPRKYVMIGEQSIDGQTTDAAGNSFANLNEMRSVGKEVYLEKHQEDAAKNITQYTSEQIAQIKANGAAKRAEMGERQKYAFLRGISAKTSFAKDWQLETVTTGSRFAAAASGGQAELKRVNVSDSNVDDLMIDSKGSCDIEFVSRQKNENGKLRVEVSSISAVSGAMAVLPVRLNLDSLSDLVVLREGSSSPSVVMSAPLAVFFVTNTGDSTTCIPDIDCSLRGAILAANSNPGNDVIGFALPFGTVISPQAPLPSINSTMSMQSGSLPNGTRGVEISGTNAGSSVDGLKIRASGVFIYSIAVSGFKSTIVGGGQVGGNGVVIASDSGAPNIGNNAIRDCFLGPDATGTIDHGNDATGLLIFDSDNNGITGSVLSGNGYGVGVTDGNSNSFTNNIIGLNAAGNAKLANYTGILLTGANNTIGSDNPGDGNTISGNGVASNFVPCFGYGIDVRVLADATTFELLTHENLIKGNRIGTNPSGTIGFGNCWQGVLTSPITATTIGSITETGRNTVSDNGLGGISCGDPNYGPDSSEGGYCVIAGNNIGTDISGSFAIGNDIRNIPNVYGSTGAVGVVGNVSFSSIGSPGGITPGGPCTGFCNLISGNGPGFTVDAGVITGGLGVVGIFNNYIGTNREGIQALGNPGGAALYSSTIPDSSQTVYVGGNGSQGGQPIALGNLISGNQGGISIGTFYIPNLTHYVEYRVAGNLIGTDRSGTTSIPNTGHGIGVGTGPTDLVRIGSSDPLDRNVISGNGADGINVFSSVNTTILNNLIGVNSSLTPLGNTKSGVSISQNYSIGTSVGGTPGTANTIANNGGTGVRVNNGFGAPSLTSSIRGNSIYNNSALGIDLNPGSSFNPPDGVSENDCRDNDTGPNTLQNYPLLQAPVTNANGTVTVDGVLGSLPERIYTIDFYFSSIADPTGHGEGETHIGSKSVTTNEHGIAVFSWTSTSPVSSTLAISATATDANGNTSEFSCNAGAACSSGFSSARPIDELLTELETCNPVEPIIVNVNTDEPANPVNLDMDICDVDIILPENQCTLRAAIQVAEHHAGFDRIDFAIPGAGIHTITPSQLPEITGNVTIDATSQPGYTDRPLIKIDGVDGTGTAFKITGSNTTISGFAIVQFDRGISIRAGSQNMVNACNIGINSDGTTAPAIPMSIGIELRDGSTYNTIGTPLDTDRNVISKNDAGIYVVGESNGNEFTNNRIGTNAEATDRLPNNNGVVIDGSHRNQIGQQRTIGANIIAGNALNGIIVQNAGSNNTVAANYIGVFPGDPTNDNGGNGIAGIALLAGATNNTIGGDTVENGNVIGNQNFNTDSSGIEIVATAGLNNTISRNYIGAFRADPSSQYEAISNNYGILVERGKQNIGQSGNDGANLIALNSASGVYIDGTKQNIGGVIIHGNGIGTNGDLDLGNGDSGITMLGDVTGAHIQGNVISGNDEYGVAIDGGSLSGIYGNLIGTSQDGDTAIPNLLGGVYVDGAHNQIGEEGENGANVISGNTGPGVVLETGSLENTLRKNFIGTNNTGSDFIRNFGGGVILKGSENILKENVVSGNAGFGVSIQHGEQDPAAQNNRLVANTIGANSSGQSEIGNGIGVIISRDTKSNFIEKGNQISGNHQDGIQIQQGAEDNFVTGNLIGLNDDGSFALPNAGNGISVFGSHNIIGGASATDINTISGNFNGVVIQKDATSGPNDGMLNAVMNNAIGSNIDGTEAVPNTHAGILLANGAHHNYIGCAFDVSGNPISGKGNLVSGNTEDGIRIFTDPDTPGEASDFNVVVGNFVGIQNSGKDSLGNQGDGISVENSPDNIIGSDTSPGNIASGNAGRGIYIFGGGAFNTHVINNFIGISLLENPLPNGSDGIRVEEAPETVVSNNNVGGNVADGIVVANIALSRQDKKASRKTGHLMVNAFQNSRNYSSFALNLIDSIQRAIGSRPNGSEVDDPTTIKNNFVGVTQNGTVVPNGVNGIAIDAGAGTLIDTNTVGGNPGSGILIQNVGNYDPTCTSSNRPDSPPFPGVVLSGNGVGFVIPDVGTPIRVPNGTGVTLINASETMIGRVTDTIKNMISGNNGVGIKVQGDSSHNEIKKTIIGGGPTSNRNADREMGSGFGNGSHGILITQGASVIDVGGIESDSGNIIANNGGSGVRIDETAGSCNLVDPNSIYGNTGLGIDIGPAGHNPNDAGDGDTGPNNLQNYPDILNFTINGGGNLIVTYHVDSTSGNSDYGTAGIYVEFFKTDDLGQGQTFLGSDHFTLPDHAAGSKIIDLGNAFALGFAQGDRMTSTATDADNNTSEFFPAAPQPTPSVTATSTPTHAPTDTPTPTPTGPPTITGMVTYNNAVGSPAQRFISNVQLNGAGSIPVSALTDFPSGTYALSGFGSGAYTITPSKTGGTNAAISSFDAAKISQYAVGITPFNVVQQTVADVSGAGGISSFDAALVASYAVSIPGSGSAGNWIFTPVNRAYPTINSSIAGEDYLALLMGEVSGNWNDPISFPGRAANSGSEGSTSVALPRLVAPINNEIIIPICVQAAANKGIIAYEFDLRYDQSVIRPQINPVDLVGTASRGLTAVANTSELGLLRIAVYGPIPIDGNGVLLNLRFIALGKSGAVSPLVWERVMFNEGDPRTLATDGQVEISAAIPHQPK